MDLLLADVVTTESAGTAGLVAIVLGLISVIKLLIEKRMNGKGKKGNPGHSNPGNYYHITKDEIEARSRTREQVSATLVEAREQTKLLRELCLHSKRQDSHLEEARRSLERIERRQEEAAKK